MSLQPDHILAAVTILMAVLGGAVSAHAPTNKTTKTLYFVSFVILGMTAYIYTVKVAAEATRSAADLQDSINRLAAASDQIQKLQQANNDLERRNFVLTDLNTNLVKRAISTVTGGDSFAYMAFVYDMGTYVFLFRHHGEYPVYDLKAESCDTSEFGFTERRRFNIGELQAGGNWTDQDYMHTKNIMQFYDRSALSYNVFLSARNDFWIEKIQVRQVNKRWTSALAVWRVPKQIWSEAQENTACLTRPDFEKSAAKLVYQNIPAEFPSKNIAWGR